MRHLLILTSTLLIAILSYGQYDGPQEVTPQILQKIKAEVEKEAAKFKTRLVEEELTKDQIEFSLDTFKIERIADKRMDVNSSTLGMNEAMQEATEAYDKLLNKYYNKLLKSLNEQDRKILITAQRAWLSYRNAEEELIAMLRKEEYSGGGSMQSNIATSMYKDLIEKRTVEIFNHYDGIIREQD